jgi:glycosyltransferase involved in cell wall biosynthesis
VVTRRRSDFDVVHVEGFAAYDADLVTVHAVRAAEQEHYFRTVEPDAALIRRRGARFIGPQSGVVMRIERRLFQRPLPPYCICPTRAVKHDLERWHNVPADRIAVIPYGLDLHRFRRDGEARARVRAELGTPPDRLVLLFVGSSFRRKGFDVAIEGLARSTAAEAELWAIGGTPAERKRAKRLRRDLGGRLRLLGPQPTERLPAFYSAADIFVLPTQQDSWAIPVTEALAAGCLAITSEFAGSCDVITSGLNGFVLKGQGAPAELAALLDGPLADPRTRTAVAARGRQAIAPYDYEHVYPRYREAHYRAYELAKERAALARPTSTSPGGAYPDD